MSFQDIRKIEHQDFYLDLAFRKAKQRAERFRESQRGKTISRLDKSKNVELERMLTVKNVLVDNLDAMLRSFPSIDDLAEFYQELVRTMLDYAILKKSLGGVNWIRKQLIKIHSEYSSKVKRCRELEQINNIRRGFYGRVSSLMKQIEDELKYLEDARRTFRVFPVIKTKMPTVAIAGFPNVGKTTLLTKMTQSEPEVNDYPFTTKGIMIGYLDDKKVQVLDTPGTLNRFNKMNAIEKQAYLAIKYLAHRVVYVYDLTEPYSLHDQHKLLDKIARYRRKIYIYLSKTDILSKKQVDEFTEELKKKGLESFTDPSSLKKELL